MPFNNVYNQDIKQKLRNIAGRKASHDSVVANNPTSVDPTSQQEFFTVDKPDLHGGSGNLAATSFDLGLEPKMVGGEMKVAKVNKTRQKKLIEAIENAQPAPKKIRVRKVRQGGEATKKEEAKQGGDFNDVMRVVGDAVSGVAKAAPYVAPLLLAAGKEKKSKAKAKAEPSKPAPKQTEWNQLVTKVRKEKGMNLKQTLQYIKEKGLYQKKGKAKSGGARLTINQSNIKASQGDMGPPPDGVAKTTGHVKSLKFN